MDNKITYHRCFALITLILLILAAVMFFGKSNSEALVLTQGESGTEVCEVQQKLIQWGYLQGKADGVFGKNTRDAVIKFQKKNGLTADGKVGAATFKALGLIKYASSSSGSSKIGENTQVQLLAKSIYAEAEGEPYIGKVAVGAVMLNRVSDSRFPNTLSAVVYQAGALESVSNGRINSGFNDECLRAAQAAYDGWDPSYGSLYFWNPVKSTSKWIWTRKILVTYGDHNFGI